MTPLKICLVSSEFSPFAKTGGLADVASALSRYLASESHDVRPIMPMYRRVMESGATFTPHPDLQDIPVALGTERYHYSVSTGPLPDGGPDVFFVRCPALFDRDEIYTQDDDEPLRFALLCRAALDMCQRTGWGPDIFHCNDWHTGLLPLYLKHFLGWDQLFAGTRTLLTLHNIGYQGTFPSSILDSLELASQEHLLPRETLATGTVNYLELGVLYADALTSVSKTYAHEIQTAEFGMGLEERLRARREDMVGIVNGVDYDEWDPRNDPLIGAPFSPEDLSGKAENRKRLLESMGLTADPTGPVLGVVSRLTGQKGFELFPEALPAILKNEDVRLVILGSGEEKYERYFQQLSQQYPGKVGFYSGYHNPLAHMIEAGSDIFLMPSRYEPCGLNQMYSLRYGTVPVVRKTGGLADTVEPFDAGAESGTGFLFEAFTADAFYEALRTAVDAFADKAAWRALMLRGMAADFSWKRQGALYVELYRRLLEA